MKAKEKQEMDILCLVLEMSRETAEKVWHTTHEEALSRLNYLTYKWLLEKEENDTARSNKAATQHESQQVL